MNFIKQSHFFIEAILLAAGASRRFQNIKQLALVNNSPMIINSINTLSRADFNIITVILGANASVIKNVIDTSPETQNNNILRTVIAEHWALGMGASIAEGINNTHTNTTHVYIGLTDQIEIKTQHCQLMIECSQQNPNSIVAAFYNEQVGAPAIFPKAYFYDLALLQNEKGAKDLLRDNASNVIKVNMPEAARDIDTKQDLRAFQKLNREY